MPENTQPNPSLPFMQGGNDMGSLIRLHNWSGTSLGPAAKWPAALKQTVRMMLNNMLPVLICWGENHIQLYNDAFRPILGQTKHPQALGISASVTYAESWASIQPLFEQVMEGKPVGFPDFLVPLDRNGYLEDCYFDFSYSPIYDEEGNVGGILVICLETTEKIRAIERVNISQQNMRNTVRQAPVGMCIIKGRPLMVEEINDLFLEVVGKQRKQFKNTPYWEVLAEAAAFYSPITDKVMATGKTYQANEHEILLIRKGREEIVYVDFVYEPIKDIDGTVDAIMIVAIDVTDKVLARKNIERSEADLQTVNEEMAASNEELAVTNEELAEMQFNLQATLDSLKMSEQKVRSVVESAPFPIAVYEGREMLITLANQSIMDVWGKGNNVVGKTYHQVLPELDNQNVYQQLDHVFTTGIAFHARHRRIDLVVNGEMETFYFNYSFTPLYDLNGEIYGVMNTAAEVTDLVIAKQKVEQSETNLHNMILQAPVAMCILYGPEHVITVANDLIIELWGKPKVDVMNKPVFVALPDAKGQGLEEVMTSVYNTGEPFVANEMAVELIRNGAPDTVYQNFVYQPYKDNAGQIVGVIATTIDVTEQVLARKRTEENAEKLKALNEELLAANEQFSLAISTANLGTWSANLATNKLEVSIRARIMHGLRPGEELTLDEAMLMIVPAHLKNMQQTIGNAIVNRAGFEEEYQIAPRDGSALKWLRSTGKVYLNAAGEPAHITGTIMDITDRKLEEQRKDDFISIASHELKTPVTSLKASLQIMDRMKDNPSPALLPRFIEQSNRSVEKITSLIDELLNTSRMSEGQLHLSKNLFTIAQMLELCCNHVRIAGKHELVLQGDESLQVYADEHRIDQVVVNMVNNAVKYAADSKEIYLIVEKIEDMVRVSVKDNGPGISPDKIPHLFSRYYRADYSGSQYSGLGLGLYISAEIIRRHGGQIGVDSELGKGSTFWFTLPLNIKPS